MNCAHEVQAALKDSPDLRLRIGIHLGEVLFRDNSAWGDGVNIASRIHALATPGTICISEHVYDAIRNKPGMAARSLGQKRLKNVSRPIGVYILSAGDDSAAAASTLSSGVVRRLIGGNHLVLAAGVVVLFIAALAYSFAKWRSSAPSPPTQLAAAAPRVIRSIAVLPLDNFSGDPNQEYFSDGLTDELTSDLATISALRVISRSSVMRYKGEHRPPTPEIAKALNVDAVVEGSVVRVGDKVRVTAQLIDAPDDRHLWAKSYERDSRDVLALQDEVALAIAREINVELTPQEQTHLARAATVNPEAHEAYLKGRYYLDKQNEEGIKRAIEYFQKAIAADSQFAPAYSGLADAYSYGFGINLPGTDMEKARVAAQTALRLDETLAEAHSSLGFVKYQYDYDWKGSEHEFQRALELNPGYAEAHHQYGWCLTLQGRFDEGLAQMKRASELDPLSYILTQDVAVPLAFQKKYEEAVAQIRESLELEPNSALGHWTLGWAAIEAGRISEAIPEMERARSLDAASFIAGWLGFANAASGQRAEALKIQEQLNQSSSGTNATNAAFVNAIIYLGMGEKDRALDYLRKAYDARSYWICMLKVEHIYDPLRSDPRFIALLKRIGLDK